METARFVFTTKNRKAPGKCGQEGTKVGETITATALDSKGGSVTDGVSYTWYTGDTATGTWTLIDGETSAKYVVSSDKVGKFIRVTAAGNGQATPAEAITTAAIQPEAAVETKAAAITGSVANSLAESANTVLAGTDAYLNFKVTDAKGSAIAGKNVSVKVKAFLQPRKFKQRCTANELVDRGIDSRHS